MAVKYVVSPNCFLFQPWVLMLEVPNILTAMSKLVGRPGLNFTQDHLRAQYEEFKRFLQEAIDNHKDLRDKCLLIEFDGKKNIDYTLQYMYFTIILLQK